MEDQFFLANRRLAHIIAKQDVRGTREWAEQQITLAGRARRGEISLARINRVLVASGYPAISK